VSRALSLYPNPINIFIYLFLQDVHKVLFDIGGVISLAILGLEQLFQLHIKAGMTRDVGIAGNLKISSFFPR
jgi:hypothetical protein